MAQILLIEDDDQVAELFVEIFTEAGHNVDRSAAAYGAVQRYAGQPYDVVVMDLLLQGANGAVATLALRGMGFTGPVIVCTGGLMPIDPRLVERAGFAMRLLKPVSGRDLVDAVDHVLQPKSG